jgi:hypothetical protein
VLENKGKFVDHIFKVGDICPHCGFRIASRHHANVDHIIPKSKGGSFARDNLVATHLWCNSLRGNIPFDMVNRSQFRYFSVIATLWFALRRKDLYKSLKFYRKFKKKVKGRFNL